ncbi:hypothetical protein DFH28DRAFT_1191756 [Melampsora americana]|nr:hypothetical protein DFH28DRAFT_1191756 [Melampsora americana]
MVSNVAEHLTLKQGVLSCVHIRKSLQRLMTSFPLAHVSIICGTTLVDAAAKEATGLWKFIDSPPVTTVFQKKIRAKLKAVADAAPSAQSLIRLMGVHNPGDTYPSLYKLNRADATFVTLICSGHCPLNNYLFCFKRSDTPDCDLCLQTTNIDHLLTSCRRYIAASKEKVALNQVAIPKNPKVFKAKHKAYIPPQAAETQQQPVQPTQLAQPSAPCPARPARPQRPPHMPPLFPVDDNQGNNFFQLPNLLL